MSKKNPAKFERCVKSVKKSGSGANPYAVCTAATEVRNQPFRDPALRGEVAGPFPPKGKGKRKTKSNPAEGEYEAAAQASEEFHGTKPHEEFTFRTTLFEHDVLGDCGELVKLEIIPATGGPVVDVKKFKGARLCQSPKGSLPQLYIEGGDQSVPLSEFGIDEPHEKEVLGKLKFITYYTVKHHLGKDGGEANFRHKFNDGEVRVGTNPKNRPTVTYDVLNKLLGIWGGEYKILPEGIDN